MFMRQPVRAGRLYRRPGLDGPVALKWSKMTKNDHFWSFLTILARPAPIDLTRDVAGQVGCVGSKTCHWGNVFDQVAVIGDLALATGYAADGHK